MSSFDYMVEFLMGEVNENTETYVENTLLKGYPITQK